MNKNRLSSGKHDPKITLTATFSLNWALKGLMIVCAAVLALSGCAQAQQPTLATVSISIAVDGKQISQQVPAGTTVQTALQQAEITLDSLDRIEPAAYTLLSPGDVIQVTRVREVFSVKETVIPFSHQRVNNESLAEGKEMLVQQGVNGIEQVTFRQVFENDVEISNTIFKKETVLEPLPEIKMVGVQKPFTPMPIPGRLAYIAGGNAWLMENSTGSRRPVVTTGDLDGQIFSLSPKGEWLLFSRKEKDAGAVEGSEKKINSLWAIDLTEEDSKPVDLKVENVIHFAAWVPNKGLTILFSTVEPRTESPGWKANNDLQMLTFSSTGSVGKRAVIIDTNMAGLYGWWGARFAYSKDGTMLAYALSDEVGLVDLDKKSMVPLIKLVPFETGSSWAWVTGLGWAEDQKVLYLVTHAPRPGLENDETSPLFDLAALPLGPEPFYTSGPVINIVPQAGMFAYPSPGPLEDGAGYRVAYLRALFPEQSDSKRYRLWVMDRDGSNSKVIFPPEDRQGLDPQQVVWSSKAFTNDHYWLGVNYQGDLWLVDSESGEAQQITGDGSISRVDWK